jgi:hypothetical protein
VSAWVDSSDAAVAGARTTGVSAGASEKERVLFSLVGSTPVVRAQRRLIYEVLARRLSPEHRLATTAKITQEVLGAVVDETLPFAACAEVVHDALAVVGMKEMKVCVLARCVAHKRRSCGRRTSGSSKPRCTQSGTHPPSHAARRR